MRLPRPQIQNCCVHVTHRCQERRFLLGTDIDRKQYGRERGQSLYLHLCANGLWCNRAHPA